VRTISAPKEERLEILILNEELVSDSKSGGRFLSAFLNRRGSRVKGQETKKKIYLRKKGYVDQT